MSRCTQILLRGGVSLRQTKRHSCDIKTYQILSRVCVGLVEDQKMMDDQYQFVYQEFDLTHEQGNKGQFSDKQDRKHVSSAPQQTSFALKMQQQRINKRITISELARRCEIPANQLSAFESGIEVPSPSLGQHILKVLDDGHS